MIENLIQIWSIKMKYTYTSFFVVFFLMWGSLTSAQVANYVILEAQEPRQEYCHLKLICSTDLETTEATEASEFKHKHRPFSALGVIGSLLGATMGLPAAAWTFESLQQNLPAAQPILNSLASGSASIAIVLAFGIVGLKMGQLANDWISENLD